MKNRLKDRIALVTGASSGVGQAAALAARRKTRLAQLGGLASAHVSGGSGTSA